MTIVYIVAMYAELVFLKHIVKTEEDLRDVELYAEDKELKRVEKTLVAELEVSVCLLVARLCLGMEGGGREGMYKRE